MPADDVVSSPKAVARSVLGYGFELVPVLHVKHTTCSVAPLVPFAIPLTMTLTYNNQPRQVYSGRCPWCGTPVEIQEDYVA